MSGVRESTAGTTSVAQQASETAMATATMRALAAHDEREEVRGADRLAEVFLSEDRRALLKDPAARVWVLKNKVAPGEYEFMIARTAFFDQVVAEALRRCVPQLVFLGAGHDSRPYRFRELTAKTRIFELDALPTQRRKKAMLEQAGVAMPDHLAFVPIDFAKDDLRAVLPEAGFSRNEQALFIWEGVTYYLPARVVDEILAAVRALSPAGSSIGFNCAMPTPEAMSEEAVRRLRELMRADHPDEPTRFALPGGQLDLFLSERGYEVIERLGPSEMAAKHLTLRDGTLIGKVPTIFTLIHAASTSRVEQITIRRIPAEALWSLSLRSWAS